MELKLAFVGFGNVARTFARMLAKHGPALERDYDLRYLSTGVATAHHGCITATAGIDLLQAAAHVDRGSSLTDIPGTLSVADTLSLIKNCDADILFETTPLSAIDGQPATTFIEAALERGVHVVTANKGPIAFGYSALSRIAERTGSILRFEGTVMDGAPVFNLVESCLPGIRVLGFRGVLNSTTNLILSSMEDGRSFDDGLAEAQRRGIAEADAGYDIDGFDAAVKAVALANVLMSAETRPGNVDRKGIRDISVKDIKEAAADGMAIRLVARGRSTPDGINLRVAAEKVPQTSPLGAVRGTSNVLILETDLMGELAIVENEPGVDQTAYALLSDMIEIQKRLLKS